MIYLNALKGFGKKKITMSQRRSMNSQSQSQLSHSTKTAAVTECIRYILYREGSKLPIKRVDIANHLSSACEIPKNEVANVIAGAENVLKNVYGYNLAKDDTKGVLQYMVVLKDPCEDMLPSPLVETEECTLLNAALAHILMSGGSVKEDNLWKFLNKAGLMKENDNAVRKLFTKTFTSQLYITCTKKDGDSLLRTTFQWGPRAHKETAKMTILRKVAEALGKEPEFWSEQYNDASSVTNTAPA